MQKGMSKLQIRAEVLLMLQQLSCFEDVPKYEIDKYIKQFKETEDIDSILEILMKELARCDDKKSQIIAYFLAELGSLEKLRDGLWDYIKDPASPDSLKDLSGIILKSLGEVATPEELLSYLNNPEELVDRETQKLMELASINPEAQIDFLDFLFSLPESEQINLINSIVNDSAEQHLANILIPALKASTSDELSAIIIDILGQIRSPYAVPVLNDIKKYSRNNNLIKLVQKSLNMLKISGIDLKAAESKSLGTEVCEVSGIYKCYASIIDGAGNQGIIVSRKKENGDILTFSTVINDTDGIIDCFGFYGISTDDYTRIINRFRGELDAVRVSPEYCKYKLLQAEQINKSLNNPICYEYVSWKSLISDVKPACVDVFAQNILTWSNPDFIDKSDILFSHSIFDTWFLTEKYSEYMDNFFDENLKDILKNKDNYKNEPEKFLNQMNLKVSQVISDVFTPELKILYSTRLAETSYLLDIQGVEFLRNVAASVSVKLKEADTRCADIIFFDYLLKKSVIEYLLRYQYNLEQKAAPAYKSLWKKEKPLVNIDVTTQGLSDIIDILTQAWRKE